MSDRLGSDAERPINVARQLRLLRRRRSLSQRALARASGLSRNTLSLLERGRTSPTVSTLHKLAAALNIELAVFFEPYPDRNIVFRRASQSPMLTVPQGSVFDLGAGMADRLATPLVLHLEPGARSGGSHIHDGQLFVFCLSGQMSYTVDDQRFELESGDSLLFDGHLAHSFEIAGPDGAEALVVLSVANDRTRSPHLEDIDSLLG